MRYWKLKKQLRKYKDTENWENSNSNMEMNYTQEQFLERISKVAIKSPNCLNGQCYCGCDTPALFLADKGCEGYLESEGVIKEACYGPMLSKTDWEVYKKTNQIDISGIFNIVKKYI